jgi:predicted NAD-dependent protein-ADP-ribosyltransferase YbiA (DUF1768 family)
MIDINGSSKNLVAARPSNFTPRSFVFDDVQCESIEGVLQSFKFDDGVDLQREICRMSPITAKQLGTTFSNWKETQTLFWNEQVFDRQGPEYAMLVTKLYDAVYDQDPTFKKDLLALGDEEICHSNGKSDPCDTVLTEQELIDQLNRLRKRAHQKQIQGRAGARMFY